jgi:sugar phosphate isomerase/epimerase
VDKQASIGIFTVSIGHHEPDEVSSFVRRHKISTVELRCPNHLNLKLANTFLDSETRIISVNPRWCIANDNLDELEGYARVARSLRAQGIRVFSGRLPLPRQPDYHNEMKTVTKKTIEAIDVVEPYGKSVIVEFHQPDMLCHHKQIEDYARELKSTGCLRNIGFNPDPINLYIGYLCQGMMKDRAIEATYHTYYKSFKLGIPVSVVHVKNVRYLGEGEAGELFTPTGLSEFDLAGNKFEWTDDLCGDIEWTKLLNENLIYDIEVVGGTSNTELSKLVEDIDEAKEQIANNNISEEMFKKVIPTIKRNQENATLMHIRELKALLRNFFVTKQSNTEPT